MLQQVSVQLRQHVIRMRQLSGCGTRLLVRRFDVCFQLPGCTGTECIELYADVKYVLCKTFGVNNPGCGFNGVCVPRALRQAELDIYLCIQDQANGSFAIGNDVVDGFL